MMSSHRRRSVEASPLALRSGQRFFFSLKGPQDSCDISTSDMLSDMQCNLAIHVTHILISDKKYGIYIVTFYLAHIHIYIYTVYNYMHICIYSNNSSDILSDIHSDVLSDMLSDRSCDIIGIYSDTVICHSIWHEYILTLYLPPTVTFHLAFCLGRCRSCSMGVPCLIRIDPHLKEEESTRKPIAKHHPLGQMDNSK